MNKLRMAVALAAGSLASVQASAAIMVATIAGTVGYNGASPYYPAAGVFDGVGGDFTAQFTYDAEVLAKGGGPLDSNVDRASNKALLSANLIVGGQTYTGEVVASNVRYSTDEKSDIVGRSSIGFNYSFMAPGATVATVLAFALAAPPGDFTRDGQSILFTGTPEVELIQFRGGIYTSAASLAQYEITPERWVSQGDLPFKPATLTISAIPEPSTWALMLAGFAMAGYTLRRRRSDFATA